MLMQNNIITRNRIVTRSLTALNTDDFFVSRQAIIIYCNSVTGMMSMQFPRDDIRVIFINTYSNVARILLCEVSAILSYLLENTARHANTLIS